MTSVLRTLSKYSGVLVSIRGATPIFVQYIRRSMEGGALLMTSVLRTLSKYRGVLVSNTGKQPRSLYSTSAGAWREARS